MMHDSIPPLAELGRLLSRENEDVVEELTVFVRDRQGYVRNYRECYREPGHFRPYEYFDRYHESPEIALVKCLERFGHLVGVDWKGDCGDVLARLDSLEQGALRRSGWYGDLVERYAEFGAAKMVSMEGVLGAHLRELGKTLAWVDINSDSYELVLVDSAQVDAVIDVAFYAKVGIVLAAVGEKPTATDLDIRRSKKTPSSPVTLNPNWKWVELPNGTWTTG